MTYINLANSNQTTLLKNAIETLTTEEKDRLETTFKESNITALVDGRGLACPMPLLKTKVALRSVSEDDGVYVLATDPNSQTDLDAFCKQSGLRMILSTKSSTPIDCNEQNNLENFDTIFHLIITKTHGN